MAMAAVAAGVRTETRRGSFYVWMSVVFVLTALLGFLPTYFAPLAAGQFRANPVVHMHGIAYFGWTLFAVVQASLIPARRVALHRALGLVGISMATVLVMLGLIASLNALQFGIAAGYERESLKFLIVPISILIPFVVFIVLGIANTRRPELHRRFMLLATIALLNAPIARPLLVWVWPVVPPAQPPVWINVPACWLSYLLILPAMYRDWRVLGRPHSVYLVALPVLVLQAWLVVPIAETDAWMSFARWFLTLAGKPGFPAEGA
jgi:hypothetical protein